MLCPHSGPVTPSANPKYPQDEVLLAGGWVFVLLQFRCRICRNPEAIRAGRGWTAPAKPSCSVDMQDATILESQIPSLRPERSPKFPSSASNSWKKRWRALLAPGIVPKPWFPMPGSNSQGLINPGTSTFPAGNWNRCQQEEEVLQCGTKGRRG